MGIKHSTTAVDGQTTISASIWNADHIITSNSLIPNLNADLLDGYHASDLMGTGGAGFAPYASDETELTVNSTVATTLKFLRWVKHPIIGNPSSLLFLVEAKTVENNTFNLIIAINDSYYCYFSFTNQNYTIQYDSIPTSYFSQGVNTISLLGYSNSTVNPIGYQRIFEVYLK